MSQTPRHQHDCTTCTFLGFYEDYDLYFCPQGSMPTVIARKSSKDSDYQSGLFAADLLPYLGKARDLAVERGLLAPTCKKA